MKLIETRSVQEEVSLLSWSPKMDLLILGTVEGSVMLHRLSWQKVWQIKLPDFNKAEQEPSLVAWHPDGIFAAVVVDCTTHVIDIEEGKIVHTHKLEEKIEAIKWCASEYELDIEEVLATKARHRPDSLRSELKLQRLETCLSALFIGTEGGYMNMYAGGFLYALTLKVPTDTSWSSFLQVDSTKDLQSYHSMVLATDDRGKTLYYTHFRTENFKRVSRTIGSLGFKYLFMARNWSIVQSELNSLNDQWSKFVDIYTSYMSFNSDKNLAEVRADYMELLFTGICTVELEMFVGNISREKEIKKHTNMANSLNSSIGDHIRTMKSAIVSLMIELNEIGGFLLVSRANGAKEIISRLRKAFNYLYLGLLHVERLIQDVINVILHFFHLLLNTIHIANTQESTELGEEECDVEKVLEFLNFKIEKNVFNFLLLNADEKFKLPPPCLEFTTVTPAPSASASRKSVPVEAKELPFPFLKPSNEQQWISFPDLIQKHMMQRPNGSPGSSIILDFSSEEVMELFTTEVHHKIDAMFEELLEIPILSTVPFAASTYAVATLTAWEDSTSLLSGLAVQQNANSLCAYLASPSRLSTYFFEFSHVDKNPQVRSYRMQFTCPISAFDIFSDSLLTIVAAVPEEHSTKSNDLESRRAIICQLSVEQLAAANTSSVPVDLNKFIKSTKQKPVSSVPPAEILVDFTALALRHTTSSCGDAMNNHQYAEDITFVDGFLPLKAAVSGPRKLGAVLAQTKTYVALIDMEPESGENSYDEEGTAEFSYETLAEVSLQNL